MDIITYTDKNMVSYGKWSNNNLYIYDKDKYIVGIIVVDDIEDTISCSNFIYNNYEVTSIGSVSNIESIINSFVDKLDGYLGNEYNSDKKDIRHSYIDKMKLA